MKLSLSDFSLKRYIDAGILSRKETYQLIRSAGFTHIDLDINTMQDGDYKETAKQVKDDLAEAGITASMSHSGNAYAGNASVDDAINYYIRTLDFCREVGCPMVVMHPTAVKGNTREEFFALNTRIFKGVAPYAEDRGVIAAVENIGNYADPYFLWNGKDLRELIDAIDSPMVCACWDVGHANHFFPEHCSQYDSIVALGKRLKCIHVHDNCGYFEDMRKHYRIDMHSMPMTSGKMTVNYDAVLQGLKDIGYGGTFNFEVDMAMKGSAEPFIYQGQQVDTLSLMPPLVWQPFASALYNMGKYMLESYSLYE